MPAGVVFLLFVLGSLDVLSVAVWVIETRVRRGLSSGDAS